MTGDISHRSESSAVDQPGVQYFVAVRGGAVVSDGIGGLFSFKDGFHAYLDSGLRIRMGDDIKPVRFDCTEYSVRNLSRGHSPCTDSRTICRTAASLGSVHRGEAIASSGLQSRRTALTHLRNTLSGSTTSRRMCSSPSVGGGVCTAPQTSRAKPVSSATA